MATTIRAFVGKNGGGKTLAAVETCVMTSWAEGRKVVSNLGLNPEAVGYDEALYVPLTSWTQIPDLSDCLLLLDEILTVMPSRQAMSVPPQLARVLNQLRKGDIELAWTAPNWMRCDVLLREVTTAVTVCQGRQPDKWLRAESGRYHFPMSGPKLGPVKSRWLPNRLFKFATYDAMEFDEFSYAAVKDVKPMASAWYWRPAHLAHRAFRTLEGVQLLDHLDETGVCVQCGGNRTRPKCSCGPAPKPVMVERRPAAAPVVRGAA